MESELPELQKFINNHWENNHIMATSKKLMDWQHYDKDNKIYNFVIAKHNKTKKIHAILGFFPTSHFDNSIQHIDIALAIWKIREDIKVAGLGLSLMNYLVSKKRPRILYGSGVNPKVIPIYKFMGYEIGVMNHYYIVNERKTDFQLIGNFNGRYNNEKIISGDKTILVRYERSDYINSSEKITNFISELRLPAKSHNYLYHRYFCHPVYDYHIYGLRNKNCTIGFAVFRLCSYDSNYALRMVDYFGYDDGLSGISGELQRLLQDYDAEYIDFYNIGIDEEILFTSGFIKRDSECEVIIPNYFEPFDKKSVELTYTYKCNNNLNFSICKADSDQDRPNMI